MNKSIKERLLESIDIIGDCWLWNRKGTTRYGMISINSKNRRVNRVAYETFCGKIPEGMCVCHACDNPKCINPKHLWLGTHKENMIDCKNKGRARAPVGEKQHSNKLTESQVLEIRKIFKSGSASYKKEAKRFGVDPKNIYCIVKGLTWKWLMPRREATP